jgi:hypothetical protein
MRQWPRPGETMPHNKLADYGCFLLWMYDQTGEAKYRDDAVQIDVWYKSQMKLNATADAYRWDYWDPAGSWDAGP